METRKGREEMDEVIMGTDRGEYYIIKGSDNPINNEARDNRG